MGIYSSNSLYKNNDVKTVTVEAQHYSDSLSIMETGYLILEENEANWNTLMKAVGLQELNCLETTGSEMVYTEAAKNEFVDGVITWFKNAFAKIKGLFDKFMAKINSLIKSDEAFVKKYEAKILDGAKNIPDSLSFKGYEFKNLLDWDFPDDKNFDINSDNVFRKCIDFVNAEGEYNDDGDIEYDTEGIKKAVEQFEEQKKVNMEAIIGELFDFSQKCTSKEFASKFKPYLYGEKKVLGVDYLSDAKTFIEEIKSAKTTKDEAKKDFEKLRNSINTGIKFMKKYQSNSNDKESADATTKMVHLCAGYYKDILNVYNKANSIHLKALHDYNRQCKAICVKLVSYSTIGGKEKRTSENASANYFQSEVPVGGIELV